jgi:hypothetical protein
MYLSIKFFSTNPNFLPFLITPHLVLEKLDKSAYVHEEIEKVKTEDQHSSDDQDNDENSEDDDRDLSEQDMLSEMESDDSAFCLK